MFTLLQLLDVFPSPVTSNKKHSEKWTLKSSEAISSLFHSAVHSFNRGVQL